MPIKLNWLRGQNLGLALIFLAITGFTQVIFIIIAQYGMKMGSLYFVIFIPIGVVLALFYSIIIIFESQTTMSRFRENHPHSQKKGQKLKFTSTKTWLYLRPFLIIVISFVASFLIMYGILYKSMEEDKIDVGVFFIIAENVGAIVSLIVATYIETDVARRMR